MSSLRRLLSLVFVIVFTATFITFAVSNRGFVELSFFPLPYQVELPKFLVVLLCFAAGITVGGFAVSLRLARVKRLLKAEHRRADALINENKALRMEHAERKPALK